MQRKNELWVLLVLLLFTALTAVRHLSSPGSDLSSSYCSCRLLATHQTDHLYSRDPVNYDTVDDPVWIQLAERTGFKKNFVADKQLHPFVQTPLWPFMLEPLCRRTDFPAFNTFFLVLTSILLSATIWLVARFWTPDLYGPGAIALICCALYLTEAYKYAMVLTQTHIIFTFMTLLALVCAERRHAVWAGALLAGAAAVKITPALLLLYWLVNRRWRASVSFVLCSALLAAASILSTGWPLNVTYLHNLSQISNMLLVSYNNQSLAAFWMGSSYPAAELQKWHNFPLPPAVKFTSTLLSIAFTFLGGILDRRPAGLDRPPYGAALALLGATIFAPIAWTHYYIVLIFPLMLLLHAGHRRRSMVVYLAVAVVFALNFDFQTLGGVLKRFELFPVVRAQFYSGLITMAALVAVSVRIYGGSKAAVSSAIEERPL